MNALLPGLVILSLCLASVAHAQQRPYIGFVYPAGAQQGTTSEIRLGGQGLDGVHTVLVAGSGVSARLVEYRRRMNNEEIQLLRDQLKELKAATNGVSSSTNDASLFTNHVCLIRRIEQRIAEFVQTPACAAISTLAIVKVSIAPGAQPGPREIRLVTTRGISNPLAFYVGQLPEFSRKPMLTATIQVLGKEGRSLRQRPTNEVEAAITIPCTVNGQIASGEINRYRFQGRKGQRLVISTVARQLVPFIADAVPGWFQPMLTLYDAKGKELAFGDDYRSQPDPVILFEVPNDAEYVLAITDALFRGREDFVYRVTIGETPFLTSIFPLGARAGSPITPMMTGWNLQDAKLASLGKDPKLGTCSVAATRKGIVSNPLPFTLDELSEGFETEPNNTVTNAQKVTLPIIVNGRIEKCDDRDVFELTGKANDILVVEVRARRLYSPLDSFVKLTDADGRVLAFNDDHEDLAAGVNTHHADSSFIATLPADGAYFVTIGDTARQGGEDYGYRLRLSAPQPDFELRLAPSSIRIRTNSSAPVTIYVQRKEGFTNSIKLELKDPPPGFSAAPVRLGSSQNSVVLNIKGPPQRMAQPVSLTVVGSAKVAEKTLVNRAVPADDQMQAFLWRHLVPAADLKAITYDPGYEPPPKRVAPIRPPSVATNATNGPAGTNTLVAATAGKPKFTKQQITRRLRELQRLYEEEFLTDTFYQAKVAECEPTPGT